MELAEVMDSYYAELKNWWARQNGEGVVVETKKKNPLCP